jgi:hypothetical protein
VLDLATIAARDAGELTAGLDAGGRPGRAVVFVDTDTDRSKLEDAVLRLRAARAIIVAVTRSAAPLMPIVNIADISIARGSLAGVDSDSRTVWVNDPLDAAATLRQRVEANPVAALTLTWLLRGGGELPVASALCDESAAYSMLLAAGEFRAWLARRRPPRAPDGGDRVRVMRTGNVLNVVLSRRSRRNAVDAAMRNALLEALAIAEWDTSLRVLISGEGPSFSAGGDLDEFGTAGDPALAHLIRVTASVGAALHRIRERVSVRVHGVCIGAGVELPSFAARVVAAPGTEFALPEIAMGLIPGAGGTVSIPRRVGRHRALWLALSGVRLDAATALEWGLIDAIE